VRVTIGWPGSHLELSDEPRAHEEPRYRSRSGRRLEALEATLVLPGIDASAVVWLSEQDTPLIGFFDDLARDRDGWRGIRTWASGEGGLTLACVHDGAGHVSFEAVLRPPLPAWEVRGTFLLEAEELERVAEELHGFTLV